MLNLLKSRKNKLYDKYRKLMNDAHRLSHINRAQSDRKMVEAEAVMKAIEQMK